MTNQNVGPKMVSRRSGRHLKSILEALRFILAKYGAVASHGNPFCVKVVFGRGERLVLHTPSDPADPADLPDSPETM